MIRGGVWIWGIVLSLLLAGCAQPQLEAVILPAPVMLEVSGGVSCEPEMRSADDGIGGTGCPLSNSDDPDLSE